MGWNKKTTLWQACTCILLLTSAASATTSIDVYLVNPGDANVPSGVPVELHVVATFDARLVATAYTLTVTTDSGDARGYLNHRSADPNETNGLTYVSETVQAPFNNGLPHRFVLGPQPEVLTDMDFGEQPGGPEDGLEPNSNVLIERVWITPTGAGQLTVTLSDFSAATTQTDPNGQLFDTMTITTAQPTLTVQGPAYYWLTARTRGSANDAIDLDPEPNCDPNMPVPVYPAAAEVTLTGEPASGRSFNYWRLYDPNFPGDRDFSTEDNNNPIVLTMDYDREVDAQFKCGTSMPLSMVVVAGSGACAAVSRRRQKSTNRR
jgi:hypothetical protein